MTNVESLADIVRPLAERDDPRFAALREKVCDYGYPYGPHPADCPYCYIRPRIDLGALVRCAAACGFCVEITPDAVIVGWAVYEGVDGLPVFWGKDASLEEALARALVASVAAEEGK